MSHDGALSDIGYAGPTPDVVQSVRMQALRVLIVEDDAMIGELLAEIVRGLGYHVGPVEITENDAVNAAINDPPDLIIIDIGLRRGDGLSALGRILARGPVAHIIMSGSRRESGRGSGVVLQKPFSEASLISAIRQALAAGLR